MQINGRSRRSRRQTTWRFIAVMALVGTAIAAWIGAPASAATSFANPAFQTQWQAGEAITTNFWGPLQLAHDGQSEPYVEGTYNGQTGQRLVQYFDKARMELTNATTGTVTSGLLATELITGRLQLGDNTFDTRQPAGVPVAGDPDNIGPTYASIGTAQLLPGTASTPNATTTRSLSATGVVGVFAAGAADAQANIATYDPDTQHNVPAAFATFRNKVNLLNIGFAISEPFWSNVKVAGTQRDVLVQAFQRRVLTYTPTNPDPFKVEFGNIGQHYYTWRYLAPTSGITPTPAVTATPTTVADTTAPKLTKVDTPYQTPYSFAVTWQTNEPASSEVKFGQSTNYESINDRQKALFTYDHQVIISGLTAGATYHFRVQSRDPAGNLSVDDQDRALTLPAAGAAVPKISNISITKKTATTFTVTWQTDVPAYSRIEYGAANSPYDRYRKGDGGDPLGTGHAATAISLSPGTVYNFRLVSALPTDRKDASASDDPPTPYNGNTVQTAAVTTALTISSDLAATQAKPGGTVDFTFSTDRPASVVIELGTTNKLGQSIFAYGPMDDYLYPFTRNLHTISIPLPAGTWYYKVSVYDEQGTGTSDVKSIVVT